MRKYVFILLFLPRASSAPCWALPGQLEHLAEYPHFRTVRCLSKHCIRGKPYGFFEQIWMPPPWMCSRPGWVGFWATWSSGKCPCPWQGGWNEMTCKVPSNSNHPLILRYLQWQGKACVGVLHGHPAPRGVRWGARLLPQPWARRDALNHWAAAWAVRLHAQETGRQIEQVRGMRWLGSFSSSFVKCKIHPGRMFWMAELSLLLTWKEG